MKSTKEERLNIGRRICKGELDRYAATEEYRISGQTAIIHIKKLASLAGYFPTC